MQSYGQRAHGASASKGKQHLRGGTGTSVNYMTFRHYKGHLNRGQLNKGHYWNKMDCPQNKEDVWKQLYSQGLVCLHYKVWIMSILTDQKSHKIQKSFCRLPRNMKGLSSNPSVNCCSVQCHKFNRAPSYSLSGELSHPCQFRQQEIPC